MKILSLNAGSSSMKFQLYEMPEEKVLIAGVFERIGLNNSFYSIKYNNNKIKKEIQFKNHEEAVSIFLKELIDLKIIDSLEDIKGIGHRIVHGGDKYCDSVIINEEVIQDVEKFSTLAPLHNPVNLLGINIIKKILPDSKNVAVFDTAFHQTMDKESFIYSVPYEWYKEYGVRRYGFHGTSHKYLSERICEILGRKDLKVITCHLGGGASITAIKDGKCIETSMGFTPLSGITMGTRSGDIDPSIIEYIMQKTGKSIKEVMNDLNKKSGVLGISGISSDDREIEEGIKNNDERCILARKIFVRRIAAFISQYNTFLNGADIIIFSAGIGENSEGVRKEVMNSLSSLGIIIDDEKNKSRGVETVITSSDSKISCYIIPTDEELMIAKETYELIER